MSQAFEGVGETLPNGRPPAPWPTPGRGWFPRVLSGPGVFPHNQFAQGVTDRRCLVLRTTGPIRSQLIVRNQRLRAIKPNPFRYFEGVGVLTDCVSPLQSETLPGPQRLIVAGHFSDSWAWLQVVVAAYRFMAPQRRRYRHRGHALGPGTDARPFSEALARVDTSQKSRRSAHIVARFGKCR
jgi:hypothetical protein